MSVNNYILPKSYRKIGLGFFILSVLVLGGVFYSIWAKVTIIITPKGEPVNQEFTFQVKQGTVVPSLAQENIVTGKVLAVEVEGSQNYDATGQKEVVASNIVGEVTIINTYSQEQTLVETTRLTSPDDPEKVLVRLSKTVTVPAGEQLKVQVYPDNEDNFIEIKPMKFLIPGLWGVLKEKIYAENSETLSKGGYAISIVTQDDLDSASSNLKEQLYQQALPKINDRLEPQEALWPRLISSQAEDAKFNVAVNDEVAEFNAEMKFKAIVIVFDESQLIALAREKFRSTLTENQQLINLNPKSISYSVQDYDLDNNSANVKVELVGSSILANSSSFDVSKILGKTYEEVEAYFSQFPGVDSVEIKFQPAWLKKTPRFKEKINIEVAGN